MRGVAAVVILSLKVVAGSPLELSMVGQDITGGPLWPAGEGRRGVAPCMYYRIINSMWNTEPGAKTPDS